MHDNFVRDKKGFGEVRKEDEDRIGPCAVVILSKEAT